MADTVDALAAWLRSQYATGTGGSGSWDDAGYDRARELAQMLVAQGITSPGDLSFAEDSTALQNKRYLDLSAGEYSIDENGRMIAPNGTPALFDDSGMAYMMEDDPTQRTLTGRQLQIGDQRIGYVGDYNNDGTYGNNSQQYLTGAPDENLLGWSARGDGNTSYRVITDPNTGKLMIVPGWNSSSDANNVGDFALATAAMLGGGYALSGLGGAGAAATGNGAWLGEGVASGIPAWDAAYTGAGGLLSGGAGAIDAATGSGAWLGEGVPSGVPAWDAAYTGAGGLFDPSYLMDPTKLTAPEQITAPTIDTTPTIPDLMPSVPGAGRGSTKSWMGSTLARLRAH
jgi:hypothetical protein